jgi:hypothetical protein
VREGSRDAFGGAIQVDIGVLLRLASRAGIQLEDVVAMTRAQLTCRLFANGWSSPGGGDFTIATHHGDVRPSSGR